MVEFFFISAIFFAVGYCFLFRKQQPAKVVCAISRSLTFFSFFSPPEIGSVVQQVQTLSLLLLRKGITFLFHHNKTKNPLILSFFPTLAEFKHPTTTTPLQGLFSCSNKNCSKRVCFFIMKQAIDAKILYHLRSTFFLPSLFKKCHPRHQTVGNSSNLIASILCFWGN